MSRPRIASLLAAGSLAAVALLGAGTPASAQPNKAPAYVVNADGTFAIRENGDAVFNGSGDYAARRRERHRDTVNVAATVTADDKTLPVPGECESAIGTFSVYDSGKRNLELMGSGEVCGYWPDNPTSIVTHVFVGNYQVVEGPKHLVGQEGWFEVRLAVDGSASATAVDF